MSMIYRINAGEIPAESWIQDAEIGGGRIVGEVCHFIDFMIYMNGSRPKSVYACALPDPGNLQDTVNISLSFDNGSIGTISYFANGPKSLPKEYFEIYKGGLAARLMDFREVEILGAGKPVRKKLVSQDKGQKTMVSCVLTAIRNGGEYPIPLSDLLACTAATFGVLESLQADQTKLLTTPLF
jgi:polar amino acid transport system substrate-binding protein